MRIFTASLATFEPNVFANLGIDLLSQPLLLVVAVVLLALNPVFLLTSGSAVVEPLMTALLAGAALAAVRRRMRLAALLAALAAVTATKAWIWIGATIAFVVIEEIHARVNRRAARPIAAAVWAVPAVAVLVFVQLGYGPAIHSIDRGSVVFDDVIAGWPGFPEADGPRGSEKGSSTLLALNRSGHREGRA